MLKINNRALNINNNNNIDFGDIIFELEITSQITFCFNLLAGYHYNIKIDWR